MPSSSIMSAGKPLAKAPAVELAPAFELSATTLRSGQAAVAPMAATAVAGEVTIQAVSATFSASAGVLTVFGDSLDNNVALSRNAAGQILVNGGAVPVLGGTPSVANTALMQVFGQAGNDTISLDQGNGALPRANLFGGSGNDVLTGGADGDMLFGQNDNDTLLGQGGNDFLFGGSGNDVLTGGDADDQMFGEGGNDRLIWNPGDDTDLFEGGAGIDTAEVNGGGGAEQFTITANGTRVRFDRVNPAPFAIDAGTMEKFVVNMGGGDDTFSATGDLAALVQITVDGGTGNDTILGSNGADVLLGGAGNDFIDGQQGADIAFLGAGEDTFQWDPGDGNDVVEGQDGLDTLRFNGSNGSEVMALFANGGRTTLTRDLGNIVMDNNDVERFDINALGGTDTINVRDLSGTDAREVRISLAGTIGGTAGDGQADTVTVDGSNGNDVIDVVGAGSSVTVLGLTATTSISGSEGANDRLVVQAGGGKDAITATTLPAGVIQLTLDGGAGNDTILGSQGADTVLGGDGNDFVFGDNGNDVAFMGAGDDVFQWNPGDGNDTIEGQAGSDTMLFFGANVNENINIVANGGRALFLRDVANVTMDLDDVENIDFRALGGADNIVIGDMSGTDVSRIAIDLRGSNGSGDGAADNVTQSGTNGADQIAVTGAGGQATVSGLSARTDINGAEAALDRLTINALGGDDVVNASGLSADGIGLVINGGLGEDVMVGSEGDDLINGGDGDDTALMGGGDDTFVWNPGDDNDTIEGQAGTDTMLFNGANAAERIDIFANGGRALFTRDIANVVMDLNDTEAIEFNALGGADNIVVSDLSGTDVETVHVDLGLANGAGDGAADTVTIRGTTGDDIALVFGDGGVVEVLGLATRLVIEGFEANLDRLVIETLAGDDVVEASGMQAGSIQLVANGGAGDDVLVGGDGNDTLLGGDDDDVLVGGPGLDVLDGGAGSNVVIQG